VECEENKRSRLAQRAQEEDHVRTRQDPSSAATAAAAAASSSSSSPSLSFPTSPLPALYCHSLWLHCLSYSSLRGGGGGGGGDGDGRGGGGSSWHYETPVPVWAREGFDAAAAMAQPVELERDDCRRC
jgi:hypothetical protein